MDKEQSVEYVAMTDWAASSGILSMMIRTKNTDLITTSSHLLYFANNINSKHWISVSLNFIEKHYSRMNYILSLMQLKYSLNLEFRMKLNFSSSKG